jgi:MtN3 and saliva related transmembrane protein
LDYISILGYVAAFFTTVSLVPEIYRTMKKREARDLSFYWIGTLTFGQLLWAIYAVMIHSLPLLAAGSVSFILCIIQAALAVKYDRIKIRL